MTVSRHKRRMSTTRALIFSLAGVGMAAALGIVGGVAIYNTEDGEVQGSDAPEDRFPETPTGMIAVVDAAGNLGSLVVFAVRPDSGGDGYDPNGGSLIPVPVSADVSGGFGDERTPLNETVSMFGASSLTDEVPALLGVSVAAEVVLTATELAALLAPIGPITVDLPDAVVGADGQQVAAAGSQTLDANAAAAVLAASNSSVPAVSKYPSDVAVWRAVAAAIGDGLATPLAVSGAEPAMPVSTDPSSAGTGDIGTLIAWLSSGPVGVSSLRAEPITDLALNPRAVDASTLDRAEVVTLFAHVAPSRVAAPNTGYNFLVRSRYADDQLTAGLSRYDVAYAATAALLGGDVQGNVLSVDTSADEAEAATIIEVNDDSMIPAAESLSDVFGTVEVRVAARRVVGINMIVALGTDYLAAVEAGSSPAAGTASISPTVPGSTS